MKNEEEDYPKRRIVDFSAWRGVTREGIEAVVHLMPDNIVTIEAWPCKNNVQVIFWTSQGEKEFISKFIFKRVTFDKQN